MKYVLFQHVCLKFSNIGLIPIDLQFRHGVTA